jgi:Mrp family chromosome partitioning ATPase
MRSTYDGDAALTSDSCDAGANPFTRPIPSIHLMDDIDDLATAHRRQLLRFLPAPLLVAALAGGATAATTSDQAPAFDARAAVHINQQTAADPVRRVTRIVPSEVLDTMTAPALRQDVARSLHLPKLAAEDITVTPRADANGDVLDIVATAPTSLRADQIAETYARLGAARVQAESSLRLNDAVALLDKEQSDLLHQQTDLAGKVAGAAPTSPQKAAAAEQLGTLSRQRTQLAADRNSLLTTSALLGPAATASGTLELTAQHNISPRLLRGVLAGLSAGLAVALALFACFASRRRLPTVREGGNLAGGRVLGVIPPRSGGKHDDAGRAAVDRVVAEVLLEHRRTGSAVVGITAPRRASGTSTTASDLAAGLARRGLTVLLIDADVRHPSQHDLHRLPLLPGLADCLRGEVVAERRTPDGVRLLPAGFSSTPADLLGHRRLVDLLQRARRDNDLVIVDVGSLEHPEALLVAALTDRVVVCAVPGRTTDNELDGALTALGRENLAGLALVKVTRTPARPQVLVVPNDAAVPVPFVPPTAPMSTAGPRTTFVPTYRWADLLSTAPTDVPDGLQTNRGSGS